MTILQSFTYEAGTVTPPWNGYNVPTVGGVEQPGRFAVVSGNNVPGSGQFKPSAALRVELRPYSATNPGTDTPADGDVTGTTSRAEVFGRNPLPVWSAPYDQWPDPAGSERWYSYSVFIPSDFIQGTSATWLDITQWKGYNGGSPPLAIEINQGDFRLGGTRGNGNLPNVGKIATINKGSWTNFIVGMRLSPDPTVGWLAAWVNRNQVIPKTKMATMDYQVDGTTPDPIYSKMGIYRDKTWPVTHVLHFSPFTVATSSLDFGVAFSPDPVAGLQDVFGSVS